MKKIFKEPQARLLKTDVIGTQSFLQSGDRQGGDPLAPGRAGAVAPMAGAQGPKFE